MDQSILTPKNANKIFIYFDLGKQALYSARGQSLHHIKLGASDQTVSDLSPFISTALTQTQQSFTRSVGLVSLYGVTAFSGKPPSFLTMLIIVLPGLYSCLRYKPKEQGQGVRQRGRRKGENFGS